MYTEFYQFREKPFKLVPDPRFLYMSDAHRAVLSHLQYGLEDRNGFVVVTGEVGSGKTLMLRVLLNALPSKIQVARVINTNFNAKELLEHILNEFGVETEDHTKPKMLSHLNQFLLSSYGEQKEALLIVDEAQNLSIGALEELRMISNLETHTEKLVQIVMVGQPQLRYKLNLSDLEQLKQRVTVQYHLTALSEKDVSGYVNHRLSVVQEEPAEIFTHEALKKIFEYSNGIPRLINVVSDAALRLGYVEEKKNIGEEILNEVIEELRELEGDLDEEKSGREEQISSPLDNSIIDLNHKFQKLYDHMQMVYAQKGEENQLVYERLMNVEKEMLAKESMYHLQERERMVYEKEREINQKLFDVSKQLDGVNSFKESLEEQKTLVQDKVRELDRHFQDLRKRESSRYQTKDPVVNESTAERKYKFKLEQLEGTQQRLQKREEELIEKMNDLSTIIQELENKKTSLDKIEQGHPVQGNIRDEDAIQKKVRQREREIVNEINHLEKKLRAGENHLKKMEFDPLLKRDKKDQSGLKRLSYHDEVMPGKRFAMLVREVLKEYE